MPPVPTASLGPAAAALAYHQGETALADFVALLKPRVMSLVTFTGVVGMLLAPGALHPALAVTAVLCIAVGAGAAGAINMWYERDIDALMARTRDRPLPAGRMQPGTALAFGVVLAVGAVTLMGLAVNHLAAGLLALSIAFYVVVYTLWLKRRTPQNIVIGGAAGAFPPVIGWAAAAGSVDIAPLTLFAVIFVWTPPHFWALALYRRDDYARAGVPMLPVAAGDAATRRQVLLYTVVLLPVSLAPWWVGLAGPGYAAAAAALGVAFVALAVAVVRETGERWARRMFAFSLFHLALLFAALLAERIVLTVA
jgi:protoheme IX farnesyltransferase